MSESQILDLLERAYHAGCFPEVLKMIRAKSAEVMIEKVIEKSKEKLDNNPFNWDDLFGAD
tara:strand:+ start:328 stop:510 length:183 start_codon:yes stop_codon:yes gene_type:complete